MVCGLCGKPFLETFKALVDQHAFAGDNLASLGLGHLQELCARRRVDDVADHLIAVQAFCRERALVVVRAHAHRCRVDDNLVVGGHVGEFGEGDDLDSIAKPLGQRFALFSAAADDGEIVVLFYECVGDGFGGTAVPEQGDGRVAWVYAVFFQIPDAAVRVGCRSAKGAADNAVFPVERVHAAREAANRGELVDEARFTRRGIDELSLVRYGDVCTAELHGAEAFYGVCEIFWFGGVG